MSEPGFTFVSYFVLRASNLKSLRAQYFNSFFRSRRLLYIAYRSIMQKRTFVKYFLNFYMPFLAFVANY